MSNLIDRQAAITIPVMPIEHRKYQTFNLDDAYEQGWIDCQDCIKELPYVEPEPKKGEWIKYCKLGVWECDQCGTQFKFPFKQHYFCPNCGADMRQREDDNV